MNQFLLKWVNDPCFKGSLSLGVPKGGQGLSEPVKSWNELEQFWMLVISPHFFQQGERTVAVCNLFVIMVCGFFLSELRCHITIFQHVIVHKESKGEILLKQLFLE